MKALFASAWLNENREYDIAVWKKRKNMFSLTAPMIDHFGLRFLEANVPGLKILEYPTRAQFLAELRNDYGVVGISFYINESNDAVEMADVARGAGVKEVWGGNYGVFTPWIAERFDRPIAGWAEAAVCQALGIEPPKFRHPPVYMHIRYRTLPLQRWGVLFTSRGCNKTCNFCQTPAFYRRPFPIDLDVIDEVLWTYQRRGVGQVVVLDENFGHFEEHADSVIELLKRRGLRWNPLTRVETLHSNYEKWREAGLIGASLGVESLNQDSLDSARKGNLAAQARTLLGWMQRDSMLIQVFYIIGFETDTAESIVRDIKELKKFHIDSPQIQILTPYPNTPMYKMIDDNYGIIDRDLSKYDSTHLVWNHPNIAPARMRELLFWANGQLYTPQVALNTLQKFVRQNAQRTLRSSASRISSLLRRAVVSASAGK
jgi:radical SAM superfamily enzyme YgiQ (UPF0313 family)